jgi:hypothetical protein
LDKARLAVPNSQSFGETARLGAAEVKRSAATGLGFVAPSPAEEMTAVLGDHCGHSHDAHHQKYRKENYGNHQDWHKAPLRALCFCK